MSYLFEANGHESLYREIDECVSYTLDVDLQSLPAAPIECTIYRHKYGWSFIFCLADRTGFDTWSEWEIDWHC